MNAQRDRLGHDRREHMLGPKPLLVERMTYLMHRAEQRGRRKSSMYRVVTRMSDTGAIVVQNGCTDVSIRPA